MVSERIRRLDGGWSLAELLVVIAVIGILAVIATPFFWTYLQSSTVRAGALEMRTALNQGKQLAITRRQNICVQPVGNGYQFLQNTCAGAALPATVVPGADGTGTFRLQNNVVVTVNTVAPVFTPLGNAAPAGQLRVTGPSGGTLTVTVSAAGRITTP
jgi:prepilin-type N-terminal cleavage/methylation domain-containing protein